MSDQEIGGYVTGVPYRLMRLRMLLTGTNAPTEEEWADALGRLLIHLETNPVPFGACTVRRSVIYW
jgi:hypothetical protein